ncbi:MULTISPECIES: RNA polymerase factor sigma-54 [Peribacillus]|uniref:RNA polymerase factor sigma-54 n=1 Tax=Peribacillus TaxID=2675229 RepID=UPI00203AEC84|nr:MULTISPECIES: RNA polymerase factor sigma-54 [Peribacillus]MCM3674335.1 RNA polymerase factor sigma-54 [Peribacillus simplex]MDQ0880701.1 RNA polymerase sigma-54 factor [Peribacillus sp. V2I11]
MQVGFELYQKQTLKLSLTPELQQSINILQYSTHELMDFLNRQAHENPVLEISFKEPLASLSESSIRTHKINSLTQSSKSKSFNGDNDYNPINNYSINTETLESHLLEQLSLLSLKAFEMKILQFLIGNLNDYGFLELDAKWAASHFSVSVDEIESMIQLLQSLDPIGVGAKDLTDCLLIQLREHEYRHELAYKIVKKHLTDLAEKRYRKIAALHQVTIQEVQEASDFIRTLNPRPVSHFSNDMTHYIVPDVYVEKEKEGFLITVNDSCTPKLSISPYYKNQIAMNPVNPAKDYIKGHINDAQLLLKGLEQRQMTLYKVTASIVDEQQEFFMKGITGLKPMTLKDISGKLQLHESTISRATSNKYIQTPHGLFKLRNFFTRGLNRVNSQATESSTTIKEKIKVLIADEDKIKPFSDQKLCQIFENEGTKISRRTIAKYREDLGIPGSSKRRRF